jgi:hypothetical protein
MFRLTDNNGWVLGKPGTRAKMLKEAAKYDADYGPVWLEEFDCTGTLSSEMYWQGKPAPTAAKFAAMIAAIPNEKLRMNVEGSALDNAHDTMREQGMSDEGVAFWDIAISTAALILDDPHSYYPDL